MGVVFLGLGGGLLGLYSVFDLTLGPPQGHLPWPFAQWALNTPLGALVIAVVGGLLCSAPFALGSWLTLVVVRPLDVTELPLDAWPRQPGAQDAAGATSADLWLGRDGSQRARSRLALSLTALLLLGLWAAFIASGWYGFTHLHTCGAAGCPPSFTFQLTTVPAFIGMAMVYGSQYARMLQVERRCGVWFRVRDPGDGRRGLYIRRPGVAIEAAATALQHYIPAARRPLAQLVFMVALALTPAILLMSGGMLLSTWLATQWIPG
jgi:hypothetical protein